MKVASCLQYALGGSNAPADTSLLAYFLPYDVR